MVMWGVWVFLEVGNVHIIMLFVLLIECVCYDSLSPPQPAAVASSMATPPYSPEVLDSIPSPTPSLASSTTSYDAATPQKVITSLSLSPSLSPSQAILI